MAMSKETLLDRLAKLETRIEKINKRISKWENKKNVESYIKENIGGYSSCRDNPKEVKTLEDLIRCRYIDFGGRDTLEECRYFIESDYKSFLDECDNEIKYAKRDLEDSNLTKKKYLNALALLDEKESRPVIKIFKDFFDNWKDEILESVRPLVDEYYKVGDDISSWDSDRWALLQTMSKEEWATKYKELIQTQKEIYKTSWVGTAIDLNFRVDEKEFIRYVDNYMQDRYHELVEKVTEIIGDITDVSDLRVGMDGTLNGIIIGEDGQAKVETIVAGGYNTDRIVNVKHGQVRHYRVLVRPYNK
jgi:hypothetical protein